MGVGVDEWVVVVVVVVVPSMVDNEYIQTASLGEAGRIRMTSRRPEVTLTN